MHELHGDQLEALLLESLDDLADESALDTIGLDHDEGLLLVCFGGHFRSPLRRTGVPGHSSRLAVHSHVFDLRDLDRRHHFCWCSWIYRRNCAPAARGIARICLLPAAQLCVCTRDSRVVQRYYAGSRDSEWEVTESRLLNLDHNPRRFTRCYSKRFS